MNILTNNPYKRKGQTLSYYSYRILIFYKELNRNNAVNCTTFLQKGKWLCGSEPAFFQASLLWLMPFLVYCVTLLLEEFYADESTL